MAELTTTKLNAESHLLLDQPLLRMPQELSRKTFKAAQREIEHANKTVLEAFGKASSSNATAASTLDSMITRMTNLKRKLESLHTEEVAIQRQSRARLQHLHELYQIPSLADVKYDEWSRTRLNRLLVDYLLRNGYEQSARELAQEKNIEDLVDLDAFAAVQRIESSLTNCRTQECLAWCTENKKELKKVNSNLEFELRLQQVIELARSRETQKLAEARMHARKYLAPHPDTKFAYQAAMLLALGPEAHVEPYRSLYSADRWTYLATLFQKTYYELYSLPSRPLLHIALSAGLSALKTPSCHSAYASTTSNSSSSATTVCPICSTELNELARNVPYAHHTKSYVENDPVILPNGRVYGRERLIAFNEKLGTDFGKVRDPTDLSVVFNESDVKKLFIS